MASLGFIELVQIKKIEEFYPFCGLPVSESREFPIENLNNELKKSIGRQLENYKGGSYSQVVDHLIIQPYLLVLQLEKYGFYHVEMLENAGKSFASGVNSRLGQPTVFFYSIMPNSEPCFKERLVFPNDIDKAVYRFFQTIEAII